MIYLKIRIELGTSDSTFDIYYDSISSGTRALLYDTGLPATGITNTALLAIDGITVSVPDDATSIILSSTPDAFCSENPNVNTGTYTISIGCLSYTVSASVGVLNYSYTDCSCNLVTATIDATYGYVSQTFCALSGTLSAGLLTVVENGYCLPTNTITWYNYNSPGAQNRLRIYVDSYSVVDDINDTGSTHSGTIEVAAGANIDVYTDGYWAGGDSTVWVYANWTGNSPSDTDGPSANPQAYINFTMPNESVVVDNNMELD